MIREIEQIIRDAEKDKRSRDIREFWLRSLVSLVAILIWEAGKALGAT